MRASIRTNVALAAAVVGGLFLAAAITASVAEESPAPAPTDPNGQGNNKCYVCHASMKTEDITTAHLAMDITCDQCHGTSTEHMHDEMLMTEPDLLFGRSEVNRMCSDPTCHAPGGDRLIYDLQDHKEPAKVHEFHQQWLGRTRPNGRNITKSPVCTDCHGTHNLDEPLGRDDQEQASDWTALFNGKDLTGWQTAAADAWSVGRGRILGRLQAGAKPVDLLTQTNFDNYLLAVTFRAEWPVHAGLWLRHTAKDPGPRVEIFDSDNPVAYTGSICVPNKGLALVSLRKDLTDREGWNTLSVKVEGRRIQVWLNGEEVGAVLCEGPGEGKIGLHLASPPGAGDAEIQVREVQMKQLPKSEAADTPAN